MAKLKNDHIRIGNLPNGGYRLFCLHCGQHYTPTLPIGMDMLLSLMKSFGSSHKYCNLGSKIFTEDEILGRFDRGAL